MVEELLAQETVLALATGRKPSIVFAGPAVWVLFEDAQGKRLINITGWFE